MTDRYAIPTVKISGQKQALNFKTTWFFFFFYYHCKKCNMLLCVFIKILFCGVYFSCQQSLLVFVEQMLRFSLVSFSLSFNIIWANRLSEAWCPGRKLCLCFGRLALTPSLFSKGSWLDCGHLYEPMRSVCLTFTFILAWSLWNSQVYTHGHAMHQSLLGSKVKEKVKSCFFLQ